MVLAVLALLLAAAFVAWLAADRGSQPSAQEKHVQVDSPLQTTLDFEVTRDPRDPVRCAVQAVNDQRAVVGWTEVSLPAAGEGGERTTAQRVRLLTTGRAETATVDSCWVQDRG